MKTKGIQKTAFGVLLVLAMLAGVFSVSLAEEFSIRNGIRFGQDPDTIIGIEKENGFAPNHTDLYEGDEDDQLYFETGIRLGKVECLRIEYDFNKSDKLMYQCYYVSRGGYDDYSYLREALIKKYAEPAHDNDGKTPSKISARYTRLGLDTHDHDCHWLLPYENYDVVIDLWDNEYGTVFLVYQAFPKGGMSEEGSLDFGL